MYIFRVKLDSVSKLPSEVASDFHMVQITGGDGTNDKSSFIGMRPIMELDASVYYIHCIYQKDSRKVSYVKISPDFSGQYYSQ